MFWSVGGRAEIEGEKQNPAIVVTNASVLGVVVLKLQADQAPLKTVLDELVRVSGVTIHYSFLAGELVTATCVADSLKEILNCLLGNTRNIVFQYAQDKGQSVEPVDVWILGSSLGQAQDYRGQESCTRETIASVSISKGLNSGQADKKKIAKLLLRLQTNDPKQRADAISELAIKTAIENADVNELLLSALNDSSALVREQALFGWVYRQGKDAMPELQQALQDPEMSVRLKAVDLSQDRDLLTLAISDSNDLVSQIAQMKLDMLATQTK